MAQKIKHFVSSASGVKGLSDTVVTKKSQDLKPKHMSETQRLKLPCNEPIDLRESFPSQCYPYQQDKITHYLDTKAEQFYFKMLKKHKGSYTQAVYEAVLKHSSARLASELYGKVETEENDYDSHKFHPPKVIPVGYSQHRQESRLNFATDIEIELPSGSIIQARSVDISPSGIQIKLKQLLDVVDGMEMDLCFPSMEVKYERHFGLVPYRLMKSTIGSMHMTLMLARIDSGAHPFDIFLQGFIDNKKYRYRIDSEDSKLALTAKAWEYLYTKALPYIACFVSARGERLQVQEIAISEHNKHQMTGLGNSMLSYLEQQISTFRLNGIIHQETAAPEIYAYRYQGTGLRRRLCATSWQFNDNQSKYTFLRAGINEDTFTAWRINVVKLCDVPQQRSIELLEKLAAEKPEQAESLKSQLNQYEYLFYLIDITESLRYDPLLQHDIEHNELLDVEDQFFDSYEIQRGHSAEFTRLRLGISKQRNEERYIYKSPILLKFYGETMKGHTLDLSINGLKVALNKPQSFQIRDTVTIDFVGFNKKFRTSKLKRQSYRIAAITRDGALCLTRDHRIARHQAAIFLSKLLEKNKEILPSCTGELWMSTKSRLMESWLNLCLPTQALLMTREHNSYDIPYILSGNYSSKLLAPFKIGSGIYNLESLLELPILQEKIRHLTVNFGKATAVELYISQFDAVADEIPVIEIKTWDDFKDDVDRVDYLKQSCRLEVFGCYNLSLGKVPRLEKSDLINDMNVIRRNARHRLTEFEDDYQSLSAVMELTDCTDLVMQRYNLGRI